MRQFTSSPNPRNSLIVALAVQVAALGLPWSATGAAEPSNQCHSQHGLLNKTLPLPEINGLQLERLIRKASRPAKPAEQVAAKPAEQVAAKPAEQVAAKPAQQVSAKQQPTETTVFTVSKPVEPAIAISNSVTPVVTTSPATAVAAAPTSTASADNQAAAKSVPLQMASGWLDDALPSAADSHLPELKPAIADQRLAITTAEQAAPLSVAQASTAVPQTNVTKADVAATVAQATAAAQKEKPAIVVAVLPSTTQIGPKSDFEKAPIIIDNDEETEQEATIELEPMPTDATGTKVSAGARFPIVITSEITTKTAKVGDPVQARLKYDLKIGNRLVAQKGSVVRGHVDYCLKARTPMRSMVSPNRWYRTSGCLGVKFDEVINEKGEHIPMVAQPAKTARYVKNKAEGRELGINHKGQIAGPWSTQLKYKAIRVGLNAALSPCGAFTFGAMPVALGVLGAANPSFAFGKPVGTNVRHRRIKGFVWGALSGVPGSWLIEDTTIKGQEAVIKPGDEFLAEIRQEFTGEPASEADMLGGAEAKVRGEVIDIDGKKSKKGTRR